MKSMSVVFAVLLGLFALVGTAEATVLRVVIVETSDSAAYMKQIERVRAANKRLGNAETVRVWRARFAGQESGAIAVGIEYADWAAFTASDAKSAADPETQTILKELNSIRKIVSDSIYEEVK